jgi:uncharacterized membrane protein
VVHLRRFPTSLILLGLLAALLIANGVGSVYAWDLFVSPTSKVIPPGTSGSFSITVSGTIAGNPNVELLISPPVIGVTAAFTTNNVPAPFTSTMVVSVDPSKPQGTYTLEVWAHPAGAPFPGPDNRYVNVQIIVGPPFDFNIQLSPPSLSVKQGETAHYQILLTYSDPSYSGTTITVDVSGLGPGMNGQIIQSYPTPGLNIQTQHNTPVGTYTIILTGSAAGRVHQTSALLNVEPAEQPFDFSISASPPEQTISPGGSTTYSITVNLVAGTSQNVALSVSGTPNGVSTSFNPPSGSPGFTSILQVTTSSSVAPGQYMMTITGTAGAQTRSTTITLEIGQAPDFRIDVSPPSQTSVQGQTTSYSISVVTLNGFNSPVTLSVAGLPAGASGVFTQTSAIPSFLSTLTITIPGNVPTGTFTLIITGMGGGITRQANVVLIINQSETQSSTMPTTTAQPPSGTNELLDLLQRNSLLVIAALIVLLVLIGLLAMRRSGRHTSAETDIRSQGAGLHVFCNKCGTQNFASDEFCSSCGNKLRRPMSSP